MNITMKTGLFILLFTYGFLISYHIMGSTKFYLLKGFDWRKALLGIYQELGYFLFLFLLFMLPQYVDLEALGVDLDLGLIVNVVLVFPLVAAIKKAYDKAIELKNIDVSAITDFSMEFEEEMVEENEKSININVNLKGDIDYGRKDND